MSMCESDEEEEGFSYNLTLYFCRMPCCRGSRERGLALSRLSIAPEVKLSG